MRIYIHIGYRGGSRPKSEGGAEIISGGAETISGVGAEGAETISGGAGHI